MIIHCYRKRLLSFLIIDTKLPVLLYCVIKLSQHAISLQLSTKYYTYKNNRNEWSFYRSTASAQLIIQEEEEEKATANE